MTNWKAIIILGSIPVTLVVLIIISMVLDSNCSSAGGVPTRIGCVKRDIFLEAP